jgi:exopolysaccharide production protein ExoZ
MGSLRDGRSRKTQPSASPKPRPRLDALQGLRGSAALLVVVSHSLSIFRSASGVDPNSVPVDLYGSLGVYAFFVISGFLMMYVHGRDFGSPRATRSFYARRIARIVPLYWTVTILYGAKQAYFGQASVWDVLRSLLFIPYETPAGLWRPVLGQGWTLNYEMIFYLVFGLSLIVARGVWLVVATFGLLALLNIGGYINADSVFGFWSDPVILYFLAGVGIGSLRARTARGPRFAVGLGVALALLGAACWCSHALGPHSATVALVVPIAAVGAVVATAFTREDHRHSIIRALAQRIGDASYSIYLTHTFVIAPAAKILVAKMFPDTPITLFVFGMVLATSIVGYCVFRFVERPLIRVWSRAFIRSTRARTTTPAGA